MAIDLDELERLAKATTPRPWKITDKGSHLYVTDANPNREIARIGRVPRQNDANAAYIVAACNALPKLIERVRELEQKIAAYNDPIIFPRLRASVENIDNSLSVYLEDSIKRAAHRS